MRLESQKRESQSQKRDASYIYRGSEDQTFSEGERETKVEQLKSDPEVNNKDWKQPQTNNFPLPAQKSVNSEEKFSAAAAVVFEIPAEKKRGFYDAVRQYAANHGARCPSAYAKTVMADLER
ncbi:hypothetical protein, partial [Coleofasciculus sp.]|uniref:hypothetical protein n=1 Tax=Coleofasciculus sp. TaxID=3100458 RepID=UPI0039F9E33A